MALLKGDPPLIELGENDEPLIMVPYVHGMLHEETVEAVRAAGYPYALWPIDHTDPFAYGALFAQWWATPGHLVVVEQDMVPPPGSIEKLIACEHVWCSHTYSCDTQVPAYGLGLCKFSRSVKDTYPTLGEQAARSYTGRARGMHWLSLNERIIGLMLHWGFTVHLHDPEAGHLHDYGDADDGS